MRLYKDDLPKMVADLKKTSGYQSRLSEQPEQWPQELTSDLYKQLPYLSDYDVRVNLDRVDPERGYAFGYADIANKTERPEVEHDEAGLPHIRVPLVIQERQVRPFTIFMDGEKVLPLSEDRVREQLFNPAAFDLSTQPPQDPSLVEPLMPPHRSGMGMGGDYKMASANPEYMDKTAEAFFEGLEKSSSEKTAFQHISKEQWDAIQKSLPVQQVVHKMGGPQHPAVRNKVMEIAAKQYGYHPKPEPPSAQQVQQWMNKKMIDAKKTMDKNKKMMETTQKAMAPKTASISLLKAIAPTLREADVAAFVEKVASDPSIQSGFRRSGVVELLVDVFDKTKRASAEDRLAALAENVLPSVVTLQKLPGNVFLVKSANNEAFVPGQQAQGQMVPQQDLAQQGLGEDVAQAMQPGQIASAVADPVGPTEPQEPQAAPVSQFGEYLAQDLMGNQVMGWVFPTMMAWDGNFSEQPMALFTNGSSYAMQDSVVGELVGKSTTLPVSGNPRGEGVFYEVTRDGARATAPITVQGTMSGPDGGPMYIGSDFMGNPLKIHLSPGVAQPQHVSDDEFVLPASWKFMALNNQTQLAQDASAQNKTAAVRQAASGATLFWNGGFNLEGGCGLDKLSSEYRYDLDPVSAEFMLGVLGVSGSDAKVKLAQARRNGQVKLAGLKTITLFSERYLGQVKQASAFVKSIPNLRRDLIKEAAVLEDESTVDKVLALNFINPENLSTFIDYQPSLEETAEKLSEMLLSSYLGQNEIPEGAVERAIRNIEEVSLALKAIAHAEA